MSLIVIMFLVIATCSFFIARFVYNRLRKRENRWSTLVSAISFVVSFLMIAFTTVVIILMNVDFGR